jgi:hypothetical protein
MSRQSMRGKSYIAVLIVASCLVAGCTTPYLAEQQGLALKRDRGEISEEEYEAALRKQREAQPWGGTGGVHEKPPRPLVITIPPDKTEPECYERGEDTW